MHRTRATVTTLLLTATTILTTAGVAAAGIKWI